MRTLAKHLIALESKGKHRHDATAPAAFHVVERLRPHLATLMGNDGFRALLSRALALASAEVPLLRSVRIEADGSLVGLEKLQRQVNPNALIEGRVVLVAQLLGLLVAFIGEGLTVGLMREVWPKVPLSDLDSIDRGQHANTA